MPKSLLTSTRSAADGNFHYYTLPKGMLKISLWQMTDDEQPIFEIRPSISIVPDPAVRYYLRYSTPGNSHNTVKVTFSEESYLSSIEVIREDKTLEIVENVIQSIKDLVVPAPEVPRGIEFEPVELFQTTIDPLDASEMDRVTRIIKDVSPDVSIHFALLEPEPDGGYTAAPAEGSGFFVRAMTMGRLTYSISGSLKEELYTLPHPTPHLVDVPFAPFVKNTLKLTFGPYGQPNAIDLDQPSWMEKASQFPGKLLSGIVAIPAQLVRLRINYDNSQEALKAEYAKHKEKQEPTEPNG